MEQELIRQRIDNTMTQQQNNINELISLLNTTRSLVNDLAMEIKIAVKYPESSSLGRLLDMGHKTAWDFANGYTDFETSIKSSLRIIKDGQEYLANV